MTQDTPRVDRLTRRELLSGAAAGGVACAVSDTRSGSAGTETGRLPRRIERIQTFPVRYPTIGYFKFFEGPPGTPPGRPAVLVKITADDGATGWGESVPIPRWSYETLESAASTIEKYLAPALIGVDPFDLAAVHRIMDLNIAPAFSKGAPITKSGIDMALHDLCGRATGLSLARRWGRPQGGPITLSWTLNPRKLDEIGPLVEAGIKRGYANFNVKVAPDPEFDVSMCRRVRKLVPDGFLWADANGGYDPATAMAVAPKLADAGVDVLEQPVRPNRISAYRALRRQGALPILMDEGVVSPADLMTFIRQDMLDGVAMKPARCGGLEPARRQVEILGDAGLLFLGSGLTDPDVSLAATLALYGSYALSRPAALNGAQFLAESVLETRLTVKDGQIAVPTGPGLGIEVDERKVDDLVRRSRGSGSDK